MRRVWLGVLLAFAAQAPLAAQRADTTRAAVKPDTSHLIKPAGALWRSLLVPGWGQAATKRHVAGAAFVIWEGVTIMMTFRAAQEQRYMIASQSDSNNLSAKRQQIQDWAVLWIFNHLFAGAEAFVSAHLQDFPKELKFEATPHRVGLRLPL